MFDKSVSPRSFFGACYFCKTSPHRSEPGSERRSNAKLLNSGYTVSSVFRDLLSPIKLITKISNTMKLCLPRIFVIGRAYREERKANFSFSREIEWTNHVSVLCSPGKPMKKTPVPGFSRALLSYPQWCAFHRRIQRKVNQWKRKGASAIKIIWSCSKFPAAAVCKVSSFLPTLFSYLEIC